VVSIFPAFAHWKKDTVIRDKKTIFRINKMVTGHCILADKSKKHFTHNNNPLIFIKIAILMCFSLF